MRVIDMREFTPVADSVWLSTVRRLHAEILSEPQGSQERRLLEHRLAELLRGGLVAQAPAEPFDPKRAAAGDVG